MDKSIDVDKLLEGMGLVGSMLMVSKKLLHEASEISDQLVALNPTARGNLDAQLGPDFDMYIKELQLNLGLVRIHGAEIQGNLKGIGVKTLKGSIPKAIDSLLKTQEDALGSAFKIITMIIQKCQSQPMESRMAYTQSLIDIKLAHTMSKFLLYNDHMLSLGVLMDAEKNMGLIDEAVKGTPDNNEGN